MKNNYLNNNIEKETSIYNYNSNKNDTEININIFNPYNKKKY